jgi:hypothetical protein
MMRLFDMFLPAIGSPREPRVLAAIYETMPIRNFSRDLFEQVPLQVAVLEVKGVLWSDWGRPQRIARSLRQIGRAPAFPAQLGGVA